MCNGASDCADGSDECICSDVVTGHRLKGCDRSIQELHRLTEREKMLMSSNSTFRSCFEDVVLPLTLDSASKTPCTASLVEAMCKEKCAGFKVHCGNIDWVKFCSHSVRWLDYQCSDPVSKESNEKLTMGAPSDWDMICDGSADCRNSVDEMNCSNKFYCLNNEGAVHRWVCHFMLERVIF